MEDVIVVTINYRLHALGFLSLPSVGISGNSGLKDQHMALEWIHENISSFNGDPDKVCLFGESAGAACVHHHMLNSKSRGFISSAIMQSNTVFADWQYQVDGEEKTRRLAKRLGAKGTTDQDYLDALLTATTQQIFENHSKVSDPEEVRRQLPFVFKNVYEQESDDAFLTKNPIELIKSQNFDKPMIFGICDGDAMTMGNFYRFKNLEAFEKDPVRLVPISVDIDAKSDEMKRLSREVKELYFGDRKIDNSRLKEFCDAMNDFHFTIGQRMANELHSIHQPNAKQFTYEFCYDGELNIFKQLLNMTELPGACHFDDIYYIFDCKITGKEVDENSPAAKMRRTMCKLWTNFAKYHDPTPHHNNPLPIKWNPVENRQDMNYLKINEKSEMKKNLYGDRINFWRKVYEKYNSSFLNPKMKFR